jgi:DNA-binding Xre family transcriptional regulator
MSMIYRKLGELKAQRNVSAEKMGEIIGISGPGYTKMIRERSCRVEYLEKLAKHFNICITEFFDDELKITQERQEPNENYFIKELLNEKERYIQRLEKDIKLLESEINWYRSVKEKKENSNEDSAQYRQAVNQ